ncbi:hypothetical protein CAPTEDRAFT_213767 [Capitella teleta]|uniref:Uncharacterized protein n=1 Tax=Capitella teleta TaxID=283909 RepID=R7U783_CAPTE|nr:hypothetical protein CAPTEDRAFT_213767 [Capitella teleta]|eukprot:ELU02230.1 hypothetical protein CAPTEDRAFT_213767 [Capitella teleta]
MAEAVSDHNAPSRLHRVMTSGATEKKNFIESTSEVPPSENMKITEFIKKNNLQFGDVVCFGDMRAETAFIITTNDLWIRNPDESGSAYLTIPVAITQHLTDAVTKFQDLSHENPINILLKTHDKFIEKRFGHDLPEHWLFDVHFSEGAITDSFVRYDEDISWRFKWDAVTLDQLKLMESQLKQPQSGFELTIELRGDKLVEYKQKCEALFPGKYGWIKASPQLPNGWRLETGASRMGSDYRRGWGLHQEARFEANIGVFKSEF